MDASKGLPTHDQLPKESTWDLSPLYSSDAAWEADFKKLPRLLKKVLSFKGRLGESPETLKAAFEAEDEIGLLISHLHAFAHLSSDQDTGDSVKRGRLDKLSAKIAEIEGESSWFEPELLALPKERFDSLKSSPVLKFYKKSLHDIEADRKHTLSSAEERILGMASDVLSASEKTFSLLNDADLKFPQVKGSGPEVHQLTHGNYIKLMESSDRELRRNAFGAIYDTYGQFRNSFASVLDGTVKSHVLESKLRKYKSPLASALEPDRIPVKVYSSLVETVRRRLPALHSYFALRAKKLGLQKLDMFDIYNPLVQEVDANISWTQAKDWVIEATRPLGEDYGKVLKRAFDERWIDYLECKGKRSGAYSSGSYRKPPYILMNFAGNLDGAFTLAHELGHSMHSYYSSQAQEFHYSGYEIFVAEVASTTNELLLHKLLHDKADSRAMKARLLNHLLDELRGTLFRQTMFAEFEKIIHELSDVGEPLTAGALCERYFKLNAEYHGASVDPDKRIELEWARIPHFHYDFYVFKYATGISAAVALSKKILAGETGPYLRFLKAGGSKDAVAIMRDAGVDFSTPAPVEAAIDLFEETVGELERVLES